MLHFFGGHISVGRPPCVRLREWFRNGAVEQPKKPHTAMDIEGDGIDVVKLRSNEGDDMGVPRIRAQECEALMMCVEHYVDPETAIPLPNVSTPMLRTLCAFLNSAMLPAAFAATLDVDTLFEFSGVANYVGHKPLLLAVSAQITALIMSCSTPEEVRALLHLENDLSDEDMERLRAENKCIAAIEGLQMSVERSCFDN